MKIALIRHGMTEGNYKKRYIGKIDEALADTEYLNLKYPACDTVISSPMRRCLETAEFIYPDAEIIVCPDLRECDFGDFEGKTYEELKNNVSYVKWIASEGAEPIPNGEANDDFKERCVNGFRESLSRARESAAFIIHGGVIMTIMQHIFGGGFYDYMIRNGGMFLFDYDEKNMRAINGYTTEE